MNGPYDHDLTPCKPGMWTPHADILCIVCHGGRLLPRGADYPYPEYLGACDECGEPLLLDRDLAREQTCKVQLQHHGLNAMMSQTGGMCSAVHVDLREREAQTEHYLLITSGEESDNFVIGEYTSEDECHPVRSWERGSVDDVVHLCVSVADWKDCTVKPLQPEPLARCWCGAPWQASLTMPGKELQVGCLEGHLLTNEGMAEGNVTTHTVDLTRQWLLNRWEEATDRLLGIRSEERSDG